MKSTKFKLTFLLAGLFLMLNGATTGASASGSAQDALTPGQILDLSARTYASLSSYSDQGQIVSAVDGVTTVTAFVTRLARPNMFIFAWQRSSATSYATDLAGPEAVYSFGMGDFLEAGNGPQDEQSPDIALDLASSYTSGASVTIPMIFFNLATRNELDESFGEIRLPDAKVGAIDCYVLTKTSQGRTKTLWIGRKDFLIHQVQTVVSAQAMQAAMAKTTNESPEVSTLLQQSVSTQTIARIVLGQAFSRSDFLPNISHFGSPYDE
jgi:hypothetical protein